MQFIEHNKQYRLMLPIFNEMALKLWRCQENKPLNRLLDDFINEHSKPEEKATQGRPDTLLISDEERDLKLPQQPRQS
jgi:hypothetical protein